MTRSAVFGRFSSVVMVSPYACLDCASTHNDAAPPPTNVFRSPHPSTTVNGVCPAPLDVSHDLSRAWALDRASLGTCCEGPATRSDIRVIRTAPSGVSPDTSAVEGPDGTVFRG